MTVAQGCVRGPVPRGRSRASVPGSGTARRPRRCPPTNMGKHLSRQLATRPTSKYDDVTIRHSPFTRYHSQQHVTVYRCCPASRPVAPVASPRARFRCAVTVGSASRAQAFASASESLDLLLEQRFRRFVVCRPKRTSRTLREEGCTCESFVRPPVSDRGMS